MADWKEQLEKVRLRMLLSQASNGVFTEVIGYQMDKTGDFSEEEMTIAGAVFDDLQKNNG